MTKKILLALTIVFCIMLKSSDEAPAVYQEGFIGEVKLFAGNYAPKGWAMCQGQLLSISKNNKLFSILGTQFGGDGSTTFALPDFRSRVAIGAGKGPGLSNYRVGKKGGVESVALKKTQSSTANLQVPGYQTDINGGGDDIINGRQSFLTVGNQPNTTIKTRKIKNGQSHYNMQPFLSMNYIICVDGVFPPRN